MIRSTHRTRGAALSARRVSSRAAVKTLTATAVVTALAALLAGCASSGDAKAPLQREAFDSTSVHSRVFAATTAQTCEAARRALLSQGYVANIATPEQVNGRKNFQPNNEVHIEVEFRVVCAPDAVAGSGPSTGTIAFVSALQERYALKKSNNSASLGVGVLGSVSLPFSSSDDALVKVASETLGGGDFYDRFFRLMARYLPAPGGDAPEATGTAMHPSVAAQTAAQAAAQAALSASSAQAASAAASAPS